MNVVRVDLLSGIGFIDHGFFGRTGGESTGSFESLNVGLNRGDNDELVLRNREKVAAYFGVDLQDLVILNQKHGGDVHVIDNCNIEKYKFQNVEEALDNEGDAIITNQKGLLIGVNTADCAPILLCDKDAKYVAAIHAGWRGVVGKIIENTIEKMRGLGCENIVAAVGPCIQKKCFEVSHDFTDVVDEKYLSISEWKILFDMQLFVLDKLLQNGVGSVSKLDVDTFGNDSYFSYRRQAGKTGLQFSGIVIRGDKVL
ncbi:MAG: peptidoglycan editing factor PgeF [Holosporales bacterium]|jgi:YfiH family protein|nr:peptidoglycan editing factor PgeF [Holosporales bacterium]